MARMEKAIVEDEALHIQREEAEKQQLDALSTLFGLLRPMLRLKLLDYAKDAYLWQKENDSFFRVMDGYEKLSDKDKDYMLEYVQTLAQNPKYLKSFDPLHLF